MYLLFGLLDAHSTINTKTIVLSLPLFRGGTIKQDNKTDQTRTE